MQIESTKETIEDLILTGKCHSASDVLFQLGEISTPSLRRSVLRAIMSIFGPSPASRFSEIRDSVGEPLIGSVADSLQQRLSSARSVKTLFVHIAAIKDHTIVLADDRRGQRSWALWDESTPHSLAEILAIFRELTGKDLAIVPNGRIHQYLHSLSPPQGVTIVDWAHSPLPYEPPQPISTRTSSDSHRHLDALETESIRIIREAVAVSKNPAMLFSMGKDSMVMLTLARKAFWPDPVPFPLVMIDTRWKFQDMYRFRHWIETRPDLNVMVHVNPDAIRDGINPFDHGSAHHTDVTKTQALKQILDEHRFDYVFGGARRDEEKSRAKERVFSVRSANHGWDPKNQRPELWNLYNTRLADGQSMRVFPLSNWTELDVWRYVERENIPVVPLYFSKVRPFVERNGSLIMVDDDRFRLEPDEKIHFEPIRFRTLGCYPLTGGVRSEAGTVADIISELEQSRVSERSSRVIDFDPGASMEQKKKEGYF